MGAFFEEDPDKDNKSMGIVKLVNAVIDDKSVPVFPKVFLAVLFLIMIGKLFIEFLEIMVNAVKACN